MNVEVVVVPPGGGQTDYRFHFTLETLPSPGDYVLWKSPEDGEEMGFRAFIVRRRWFWVEGATTVTVEVEPARYAYETDSHRQLCEMYAARGKPPQRIEDMANRVSLVPGE